MENRELNEMNDHELLVEIAENSRKEANAQKIASIFVVILTVVVIASIAILVPKAMQTFNRVDTMVQEAETTLNDISGTVSNMNEIIAENRDYLEDAIKGINSIDFDSLKESMQDLQDIISPLANLFKR